MGRGYWLRRGSAVCAITVVTLFGLTACTPSPPIGFLKQGNTIAVVVLYQCGTPAHFVSHVRVENYGRGKNGSVQPPLWEIQFDQSLGGDLRSLPKIELGNVPEGFTEVANNIATQGIGATLDLKVWTGDHLYSMLFDTAKFRDGKVLDAARRSVSERDFMDRFACRALTAHTGQGARATASALD